MKSLRLIACGLALIAGMGEAQTQPVAPGADDSASSASLQATGAAPVGGRPSVPAGLSVWLTGDPADVVVDQSAGPAVLLMGGGTEVDKAFANRALPVANGGDIVVLRASGSDGYNDYLFELVTGPRKPNSVETLLIDTRAKADSAYVAWVLAGAEMVWMAGGDQSDYTGSWRGTAVQTGLQGVYDRGGVIGGTSAGMAVMAALIYDPGEQGSLTSAQAFANAYHPNLVMSPRLVNSPWMDATLTDTHFKNRDRMGRSMAMMAWARQEGKFPLVRALCLSEQSSLFIDRNGMGWVDTNTRGDALYALVETAETQRTQVTPGQPLVYGPIHRYRLTDGKSINLATWTTNVAPMRLSANGSQTAQPYDPADPYADQPLVTPTPTSTIWMMNAP